MPDIQARTRNLVDNHEHIVVALRWTSPLLSIECGDNFNPASNFLSVFDHVHSDDFLPIKGGKVTTGSFSRCNCLQNLRHIGVVLFVLIQGHLIRIAKGIADGFNFHFPSDSDKIRDNLVNSRGGTGLGSAHALQRIARHGRVDCGGGSLHQLYTGLVGLLAERAS